MTLIDPTRTWALVEERLATETDPTLRRNLATVLEHMQAEAVGDIDRLMARSRPTCTTTRTARPIPR